MKIKSRKQFGPAAPWPFKSDTIPVAPANGSWPFPSKKPEPADVTAPDEEVIRRTTKDVDVTWFEID